MPANASKYPQPPFTQAIALSGDRVGSKGTFHFAGFGWICDTKVILVQGNIQSLNTPPEWRQLLRLIRLAHRLRKPIVLWNLPVAHIATKQRKISLANTLAIQDVELALLKLPHPIITVIDETCNDTCLPSEPFWNDGIVLVSPLDTQLAESQKVKIVQRSTEIAPAILELLYQAEAISAAELIEDRRASLHMLAKSKVEFSSKLPST